MSFVADIFVPLFVVMNAAAVLPIYLGMTAELAPPARSRLRNQALLAGLVVVVLMTLAGSAVLRGLGITVHDLRIAGGIVLLVFAVHDLLFTKERRKEAQAAVHEGPSVVPLGVPLIVGPATMTALIVLSEAHGAGWVLIGATVNVGLNWLVLRFATQLIRLFGLGWIRVFAKVMGLFLAAIATSMIRLGLTGALDAI